MGEELSAVTLARIEGKLDLLHAAISAAQTQGADHENRLRALESARIDPERVTALEARPTGITPKAFLSTLVGFSSLAAALSAVVTVLSR